MKYKIAPLSNPKQIKNVNVMFFGALYNLL